MNPDLCGYFKYMSRARFDNALNTLRGILGGIAMDSRIDGQEIALLDKWLHDHSEFRNKHPFNEIIPVLEMSLLDERITEEEHQDLIWICNKLKSTEYYDSVTADMQCLHGIIGGILSDGIINKPELEQLSTWIDSNKHLCGCWPYEEVASVITGVLSDGKIDESEHGMLKTFFSDFVGAPRDYSTGSSNNKETFSIHGLCAVCPEITFNGSIFCFTGNFLKHKRSELLDIIRKLNGIGSKRVAHDLDYLVVGSGGNTCWAYACYGRKVEQAVTLRKNGSKLILVHENDFMDSVYDAGIELQ